MLIFNVSGGSHRTAVYQPATVSLCPFTVPSPAGHCLASTVRSIRSKLVATASWVMVLTSSFFEYGLGEDFPLTPLLCLAVTVLVTVIVVAASGMRPASDFVNRAKLFTSQPSRSGIATSVVHIGNQMARHSRRIDGTDARRGCASPIRRSSGNGIVNACDVFSGLSLLNSPTDRGPPAGCVQNHPSSLLLLSDPAVFLQSPLPPNPLPSRHTIVRWKYFCEISDNQQPILIRRYTP